MYKPVLLLALLSKILLAANPAITLQVSSETAPPGGYAQFKISLTAPALVSIAGFAMKLDPTVFGPVASVAAFSATGDQTGFAYTGNQQVFASLTSVSSSFGQLPGLPIFVVTVPVLPTAKIGATSSITIDPTQSASTIANQWQDPQGNAYLVSVNPGTFTIGGTLSVQNVTPGGGLIPSGTVVAISGTGFEATTIVTIDGVSVASSQLVSPQELNVTLGGATEMAGKHVHVSNSAGESHDYFAGLSNTSGLILPALPSPTYTAVQWSVSDGDLEFFACLQNPSAVPITATFYPVPFSIGPVTPHAVVIPPFGLYVASTNQLAVNSFGPLYMAASAPLRMAVFTMQSENFVALVGPPGQLLGLGQFGIAPPPTPVSWNWEIGTPAPQPQTIGLNIGLPITATLSADAAAWLQLTQTVAVNGATGITLTPMVSNLAAGTYTGTIALTPQLPPDLQPLGPGIVSFSVTINVSAQPTLGYVGGTVPFSMNAGGAAPAPRTISLTSNGTPAAFTTSITGGSWLSVTPSSGTATASLTLTVNPAGLSAGSYYVDLKVQGPINTLDIIVQLNIVAPQGIVVEPASLIFSLAPGQPAPAQPQTVSVMLAPSFTATVATQTGANWLTITYNGSFVYANASAVNLAAGTYTGTITVTSRGSVGTISVTLVVASPGQMSITPSALVLTAPAGISATAALNVSIASGSPYFTVQLANLTPAIGFESSVPIAYSVSPASSTSQYSAPATIQVSSRGLALPGTYQASLTVSWNGGSAVVPVTIYVTAAASTPPIMSAIVSSGSATPGSISPGELITIFGSGLLGGTEVLINGTAAPMLYTSTGQVNAIVPYEVTGTASVKVVAAGIQSSTWDVPVAASAPSIFTSGATGVGQGAIVNQDGSVNSASNPASRGTAVQIYATGGGQTSPPSSTGSVAKVAANLILPVSVTIGGVNAQVLYAGAAPGEISGVVQINAMIPQSVTAGAALPVIVTIGGVASQTATAAVQ